LLRSQGASDEGDMPLLQTFDLKTKKTKKVWQSKAPYYEQVVTVIDPEKLVFITSKESVNETPNYYIHNLAKKSTKALTNFTDPQPALRQLSKEKIFYERKDGVDLTGTLYLPAGYNKEKDGPLPVLIWAYPREFKSANDAAQVRGSKYTFTRINYGSPVFWAMQG
jgi:dipeptidyl aminopeptidase/acylaminoacyl peptidase